MLVWNVHGVHKWVYARCKPRRSRQEQMMVKTFFKISLLFPPCFKYVTVGATFAVATKTLKVFWDNLAAGRYWIRGDVHTELMSSRVAVRTPEFWFLMRKWLSFRENRWNRRQWAARGLRGASWTDCDLHAENLCGSLETAGLLQWLVFATALKETAILPLHPLYP